jgi:hypothetical protein
MLSAAASASDPQLNNNLAGLVGESSGLSDFK